MKMKKVFFLVIVISIFSCKKNSNSGKDYYNIYTVNGRKIEKYYSQKEFEQKSIGLHYDFNRIISPYFQSIDFVLKNSSATPDQLLNPLKNIKLTQFSSFIFYPPRDIAFETEYAKYAFDWYTQGVGAQVPKQDVNENQVLNINNVGLDSLAFSMYNDDRNHLPENYLEITTINYIKDVTPYINNGDSTKFALYILEGNFDYYFKQLWYNLHENNTKYYETLSHVTDGNFKLPFFIKRF